MLQKKFKYNCKFAYILVSMLTLIACEKDIITPTQPDNIDLSKDEKWSGIKNGALLKLMQENDFDALVTMDQNMQFQHNLNELEILLVVLDAKDNKLPTFEPFINLFEERIPNLNNEKCITIGLSR